MLNRIMFVGLVSVQYVCVWEVERETAFPSAEARERERKKERAREKEGVGMGAASEVT